ncbi:hypothetical protein THAOC_07007 [Thalassiosira oceanica]|uniref:Uncharacterized protein n=1 Tax=Thalassiosira oceanica TaxID=159749 RepID=K0SYQ0_THAOC|nr:hypothetical protein THAOC_07007 [Thalassiosira oceanica]|eukprot:EJK71538.1 hypothetical protein THAOC_07007 [Thalassiosira oceanica]
MRALTKLGILVVDQILLMETRFWTENESCCFFDVCDPSLYSPGSDPLDSLHSPGGGRGRTGRVDPGVNAGRRNLRVPLLELTSDPRSVAQREPSPAVMRLYVSVSSIERMMGAAGGVDFLMNGHWTALVDFGSLRQTYPHVEVLDARADVGQEDALLGHGTTRAMFALQRGRPEDFACLLDDDVSIIDCMCRARALQD